MIYSNLNINNNININNSLNFELKTNHGEYYTANVCYGALSNASYFDYMHLVFWFFFLTTFSISLWLIYTFIFICINPEYKKPTLETRGFSRAQTGDTLTAIIPMTWSITMLMHANTNSSNFDENTDSTNFSINIIAYQWGWNYFLPKDILNNINNTFDYSNLFPINDYTKNIRNDFQKLHKNVNINFDEFFLNYQHDILFNKLNDFLNFKKINFNNSLLKESFNNNIINNVKYTFKNNFQINKIFNLKKPKCIDDLDVYFLNSINYNEFSSSRNSISSQNNNFELFGGLTSRLNITSGLVLPSDTPIHIICGSKDVIHSWAIPGLFVKIDCIPGYNCHKRVFFRWRGLYWGQCMEVCGRYHHWMPILIKITHYDLFILWLNTYFN